MGKSKRQGAADVFFAALGMRRLYTIRRGAIDLAPGRTLLEYTEHVQRFENQLKVQLMVDAHQKSAKSRGALLEQAVESLHKKHPTWGRGSIAEQLKKEHRDATEKIVRPVLKRLKKKTGPDVR